MSMLDFWKTAKNLNGFWDVMVDEQVGNELLEKLSKYEISYIKTIDDVQKLIMARERAERPRRLHDESSGPFYDFGRYGSYDIFLNCPRNFRSFQRTQLLEDMVSWMHALAKDDPQHVLFVSIGTTHEGRSIDGVEIGHRNRTNRIFWIDGGIHAREWAAPHTALYFIRQVK
uniref:Peptidase_M14 domain-containing protein n=1 Tax=Angiostrongylus cantonensis TaxID=6313 RepID=A0A0K0DHD6_ANGCA